MSVDHSYNFTGNNISLPIVGYRYSCTRIRDAFASLIMPIETFNPPSYWYNLSNKNERILLILLLLEDYLCILEKCGFISRKNVRREMTMIIPKDQGISFISEYELINAETNKSKLDVFIENRYLRKDVSFIGISKIYILHLTKNPNNTISGHLPPVIHMCHITYMFPI